MPEFYLNANVRGKHPFYALDEFARGYVEAMFFTNGDCGDEREWLLNDLGVEKLTKLSVETIKLECDAFLASMVNGRTIREWLDACDDYSLEQAGHDFWFSRQGHGTGYWDREQLDSDTRDVLESLCGWSKKFSEVYSVEAYRGWIYYH